MGVLKPEAGTLTERLRQLQAPQRLVAGPRTTQLWDLPELTSLPTLGRPVRVVWPDEQTCLSRLALAGRLPDDLTHASSSIWPAVVRSD